MSLNIFPDLLSNMEIKRIAESICNTQNYVQLKSPRGERIEGDDKDHGAMNSIR